jgi:hypothetical protein
MPMSPCPVPIVAAAPRPVSTIATETLSSAYVSTTSARAAPACFSVFVNASCTTR